MVATPDKQWGESPCAFVTLTQGVDKLSSEQQLAEDIVKFC